MAVSYDFYEIPDPKDSSKMISHVRVVPNQSETPKEIEEAIQKKCTLTRADIRATLSALTDILSDNLLRGNSVHLQGIGYFSLSLKMDKSNSVNKMYKPNGKLDIKSISFRPEISLIEDLRASVKFEQSSHSIHSKKMSQNDILSVLNEYFRTADSINRRGIEKLFGCTRTTAYRWIKMLDSIGAIKNIGDKYSPLYVPIKI